jgi:cyclopropane fatty-acyl-phospholipid synthase-like methyltransferase
VPSGKNGATISEAQRKRLEARISELGLERERVKAWLLKASKGRVQSFDQLSPAMYQTLDARMEVWAERTAIQEESQ